MSDNPQENDDISDEELLHLAAEEMFLYLDREEEAAMHPKRHVIEVTVRYLTTAEGGRRAKVCSGYRGQFYYNGDDWDGFQSFPDFRENEYIELGQQVRAFVDFSLENWTAIHQHQIKIGTTFLIREGNKTVGNGVVTRLNVEPHEWGTLIPWFESVSRKQ